MDYPIDYEQYTIEEIILLVSFLSDLERYKENPKQIDQADLKKSYASFKRVINNMSEEKRIDQAFEKQTNISIYKTMKAL